MQNTNIIDIENKSYKYFSLSIMKIDDKYLVLKDIKFYGLKSIFDKKTILDNKNFLDRTIMFVTEDLNKAKKILEIQDFLEKKYITDSKNIIEKFLSQDEMVVIEGASHYFVANKLNNITISFPKKEYSFNFEDYYWSIHKLDENSKLDIKNLRKKDHKEFCYSQNYIGSTRAKLVSAPIYYCLSELCFNSHFDINEKHQRQGIGSYIKDLQTKIIGLPCYSSELLNNGKLTQSSINFWEKRIKENNINLDIFQSKDFLDKYKDIKITKDYIERIKTSLGILNEDIENNLGRIPFSI
jgi:hypothetical protein